MAKEETARVAKEETARVAKEETARVAKEETDRSASETHGTYPKKGEMRHDKEANSTETKAETKRRYQVNRPSLQCCSP